MTIQSNFVLADGKVECLVFFTGQGVKLLMEDWRDNNVQLFPGCRKGGEVRQQL